MLFGYMGFEKEIAVIYSNLFLRQAQGKLAQGENHSKGICIFGNTITTAKLFQTVISRS
jgi:hypothetical protein